MLTLGIPLCMEPRLKPNRVDQATVELIQTKASDLFVSKVHWLGIPDYGSQVPTPNLDTSYVFTGISAFTVKEVLTGQN